MTNFEYFCNGDTEAEAMEQEWCEQQRQREYTAQVEYERQMMEAYDAYCAQEEYYDQE